MGVQGQPKKSLKEIIAEEYRKCALDPIYFMKKYCVIQHPVRGKIPFHLYPFQEECLTDFKDNRLNIILKSRQLGLSTLSKNSLGILSYILTIFPPSTSLSFFFGGILNI